MFIKTLARLLIFVLWMPLGILWFLTGIMSIFYVAIQECIPDRFWEWLMPTHED